MQISSYWTLVKNVQEDFLNASQIYPHASARNSFIGFCSSHLQRLLYPSNIFLESKNQQISAERIITNWFLMHCKGFLVHFLPKCSFSDKSVHYRTFSAHLVDIRPTMHRETIGCQPTWYKIILPDYQAVTRKLKKKFALNLDFWCPTPHIRIIKHGDIRLPR